MKAIEVLDPKVQACIKKRGLSALSDAQKQAIPLILKGNHVVLIAPTGTGKTESAMFPGFNALLSMPAGGGIKALYITPLRSLNAISLRACNGGAASSGCRLVCVMGTPLWENDVNRHFPRPIS